MTPCVFSKETKCAVLEEKQCSGCAFRKSLSELERGRRCARIRINSLPQRLQAKIKRKYYPRGYTFEEGA
jgi:hypothetical protein